LAKVAENNEYHNIDPQALSAILVSVSEINFGQCIPSSCTDEDVFNNSKALLGQLNLKTEVMSSITKVDTDNSELPPKTVGYM
jgi:hypothetical protein